MGEADARLARHLESIHWGRSAGVCALAMRAAGEDHLRAFALLLPPAVRAELLAILEELRPAE